MATQLQDNISTHNDKVVAMLQQVLASQALPPDVPADDVLDYAQQANATTSDSIQLEMLRILRQME